LADLAAINFAACLPTILVSFASLKGFLLSTEALSITCFRWPFHCEVLWGQSLPFALISLF